MNLALGRPISSQLCLGSCFEAFSPDPAVWRSSGRVSGAGVTEPTGQGGWIWGISGPGTLHMAAELRVSGAERK